MQSNVGAASALQRLRAGADGDDLDVVVAEQLGMMLLALASSSSTTSSALAAVCANFASRRVEGASTQLLARDRLDG